LSCGLGVEIDGEPVALDGPVSVLAAAVRLGKLALTNAVDGTPRGGYCLIGLCFECLVEVDGVPRVQACTTTCRDGMKVRTSASVSTAAALPATHGGTGD
jgi:D-hydroxyproline dehydrogenase subunit gamma